MRRPQFYDLENTTSHEVNLSRCCRARDENVREAEGTSERILNLEARWK
jgi:hypothetical protein